MRYQGLAVRAQDGVLLYEGPVRGARPAAVVDADAAADEFGGEPMVREIPEPKPARPEPTPAPTVRVGMEDTMLRVLDYVVDTGGEVEDEPGKLLHRIADDTGLDYYAVAAAVRRLEDVGFVSVERSVDPIPRQSNRVCRIAIV